jgi:iron complex outermembrane recepter protein
MKHSSLLSQLTVFLGVCASASLSSTAYAQNAATTSDSLALEEVVVTGSRVITNGNDSPTPVTVVNIDQLQEMNPGPVTQALAMLPALLGTPNQGGQGPQPQAVINLRGLGGTRNLIMFDGHRLAPTTGGNGVDTNLIPQLLLKRVDIVTGGASAVYGSDAVSGVVNYIVDNNFNGLKVTAQTGQSTYHDDKIFNGGIAVGTPVLGGRGHVEFSYQVNDDPGIPDRFARAWGRNLWSTQGSVVGSTSNPGTQANPFAIYSNTHLNDRTFGGLIKSGPLVGLQFAQNGVLSSFVHGAPTGSSGVEIGGDGAYYTTVDAIGGQNLKQGFGRFDYDFTDDVKGYVEVTASSAFNWGGYGRARNMELTNAKIGYNNPYLAAVQPTYRTMIANQLAANPLGTFNFSRVFTADQFARPTQETTGKQILAIAGLDGSVGDYKWDLGYEHSDAKTTTVNRGNVNNAKFFASLNAVLDPATNQIVCNAALVNPAVYGDCLPLNPFGPNSTNSAAAAYSVDSFSVTNKYIMDDINASITGAPLSTWVGPINMALSGEWRKLSYEATSNALPTDPVNCTGIQFNCPAGLWRNSAAGFPNASVSVSELAYEAQIPLLQDVVLAKSLGLNAAARYTDYETSGPVWTWKLGTTWAMNDALTVRAARSRDIRAPSLQDLFQPQTQALTNIQDVHTGQNGDVIQIGGGNPDLVPEKADTWTVGLIWTPQFIDGLSVSMDYYRINITDGLLGTGARQPATQQACENSGGSSPICSLYVRPFPFSDHSAANFPTAIKDLTLNTAGLLAYGVDAEIDYRHPIAGRDFMARLLVNYQPHLIYDLGPAGILDVGGAADGVGGLPVTANVKGVLQLSYEVVDNLKVTLQERYRNAVKQNGSQLLYFAMGKLGPATYTDLNLNYKMQAGDGDLELFFNVRNLLNTQPEPWASSGGSSQIGAFGGWAQGDDPVGRFYTIGLRYRL